MENLSDLNLDKLPHYNLTRLAINQPCDSELILNAKDTIHPDWQSVFFNSKAINILLQVDKELGGKTFYPEGKSDVFRAFKYRSPTKVKVVILGQDPYYAVGKGEAHGLSFSVKEGVKIPASLQNIFKALINDDRVQNFDKMPKSGSLVKWAKRGVLLLNSALTVEPGKANSHKDIWRSFTDYIISQIEEKYKPIFVLWGNHAKERRKLIEPHVQSRRILEFGHFTFSSM